MPRYHINPKGEAKICFASKNCPFGDLEKDHYGTKNEAIFAFESKNQSQMFKEFAKGKDPQNYLKVRDILTEREVIIPKVDRIFPAGKAGTLKSLVDVFNATAEVVYRSDDEQILQIVNDLQNMVSEKDFKEIREQISLLNLKKFSGKAECAKILKYYALDISKELPLGFSLSNARANDAFKKVKKK